jgi:hypothetical protein
MTLLGFGGNPGELRRCAGECLRLESEIAPVQQAHREVVSLLMASQGRLPLFSGAHRDALLADSRDTDSRLADLRSHLRTAAAALNMQADKKEEEHRQSRNLLIIAGVAALTFATMGGFGAAALGGAALADVVMSEADITLSEELAASSLARFGPDAHSAGVLGLLEKAMDGVSGMMPAFQRANLFYMGAIASARFAVKLGGATWDAVTGAPGNHRWMSLLDAFNPDNYTATDWANLLIGTATVPYAVGIPALLGVPALAPASLASIAANSASSGIYNGTLAGIGQFWFGGKPLDDPAAWQGIGVATATSTVAGGVAAVKGAPLGAKLDEVAGPALDKVGLGMVDGRRAGLTPEEFARTGMMWPTDSLVAVITRPGDPTQPADLSTLQSPAPAESRFHGPDQAPGPPVTASPAPTIVRGSQGTQVAYIQRMLNAHGQVPDVSGVVPGYHTAVDGVFGEKDRAAILWFQYGHRLTPTGVPDAPTLQLMRATLPQPR